MNEKNPYESDDTVDIPDFSSIKVKDDDIDRSIFKMNDDEPSYDENDDEEEYEEDDDENYRTVKKSGVVLIGAVIVVLLVLAVFGIFWGVSKNKAYTTLKNDYDAYVSKAQATETELNNKIAELQNQINNSSNTNSGVTTGETSTYKMSATVRIRTGAGTSNSQTKYNDLADDIKKYASDSDGMAFIDAGTVFTATESKSEGNNVWVKMADNAWVCIKYGDETWATKQ